MNHRRSRLAWAMLVVLVVALDCALMRATHLVEGGRPNDFRFQTVVLFDLPMANVLAVALVLAARRSGPARRFWVGFAACSAVTSTLVLAGAALIDREVIMPWTQKFGLWTAELLFGRSNMLDTPRVLILLAVFAATIALPQVAAALLVGLIARYSRKVDATTTPPG